MESGFEQDFMSQVRGNETSEKNNVRTNSVEKKFIDKRWFIIGGLIVVLVVVLVLLIIIGQSSDDAENPELYQGNITGFWACNDGLEMEYRDDATYVWLPDTEARVIEGGTFENRSGILVITQTSLSINDESMDSDAVKSVFELRRDGDILFFRNGENNAIRACVEIIK